MHTAAPGALQGRADRQASWPYVLKCALRGPCLSALLASGGYLDQLLRDYGQVGAQHTSARGSAGQTHLQCWAVALQPAADIERATFAVQTDLLCAN